MFWVSGTHTSLSQKRLATGLLLGAAAREKTKTGVQRIVQGSGLEAGLPPPEGPPSALSREETVSW
ncbi:hypothetical protein I79_003144 [Cricetulus griseus]|uniref:Uncharacterized protein n=1 Tax=Cricetulus griseus TaxID=10029 RepID=G3GZ62_CRIGR|nr:hypothetical protein I79_003144 [Cricetulus griseus]